jgi:hemerythrin-like metal-binding protein
MAQFSWTDDLYTGSTLIDGDHRKLVDLVNALFETMQSGQGNGRLAKAMNDLIAYTGEHFAREEAKMERIQYVAALAHKTEHTKLLKQLVELKEMLDAGGRMNISAVAAFLSGWLRDHILAADMKLAAALKQQHSSAPVAQLHSPAAPAHLLNQQ